MSVTTSEYLRTFLNELDRLKPPHSWGLSHAISSQEDSLCVLISLGDGRERVFVKELDPDPVKAAGNVVAQWKGQRDRNENPDLG
jgi:hypothetical protein